MTTSLYIFVATSLFFIVLGFIIPYTEAGFGETPSEYDTDIVGDYDGSYNPVTFIEQLGSVISIFFFDFTGSVPAGVNVFILNPLRFVWLVSLIKMVIE